MTLIIRAALSTDAPELARLLTVLGHPTEVASIERQWARFTADGNAALVSLGTSASLSGLITMHTMQVLHRTYRVGRITALVVDEARRCQGIGARLVAAAESWFDTQACGLYEVTSNLRRADAHAFYERIGYVRASLRLAKTPGVVIRE